MLYALAIVFTYFFEMLTSYIFYAQQGEPKRKNWVGWSLGGGLFLVGAVIYMLFSNIAWLNGLIFIGINFLFGFLAFDIRWTQALLGAVILDILSTALEIITIVFVFWVTQTEVLTYIHQLSFYILIVGISKTAYFVTCIFLARIIQREKTSVRFPKSFFIYPFTVLAGLILLWDICVKFEITGFYLGAVSVLCVLLLFSLVLLFLTYQSTIQKENTIFSLQNQMEKIKIDKRYYDILEKQNQDLLIYAHDAKNHLAAIQELNTDPEIDNYLSKMSEQLQNYSRVGHSGNRLLDIICSKYAAECALHGVVFEFDTRLANLKYVDDYDLVTILDNLLDNALEAAAVSGEKKVELFTDHKNTYDVITVLNSCDAAPVADGQNLVTTKKDAKSHGLGIKSVARALKSYQGDYDWIYDADKKQFAVTVMLSPKP